jgi:phosphoadenosine phosphosulfate reductase
MATGPGPEGCVIISMLARLEPRVYVFNLDTGYQFAETLRLRERIREQLRHGNPFGAAVAQRARP